jgi:hypothetical protein
MIDEKSQQNLMDYLFDEMNPNERKNLNRNFKTVKSSGIN